MKLENTVIGQAQATGRHTKATVNFLALLIILTLGGIQLYFFDVTFHGPDQIRDMEIARKLINEHEWPLNSPPMFGERVVLPPGFYYLLALPLLIKDSDASVFIAFGILFAISAAYLWRQVSLAFGERCGLIFSILAFPLFPSLYAHSAWNPALVITLGNVVLGLYIQYVRQQQTGWFALPIIFFLLLQIHPSAAPLLLGFTLYGALNRGIFLNGKTILSIVVIILATTAWLVNSDIFHRLQSGALTSVPPPSGHSWLANLLNFDKWRDAFLMPYSLVTGIHPAMKPLNILAAIHLAAMLGGVILCLMFTPRNRIVRWILAITAIWFMASMAFLGQGGFWHLDVIHPWLAVASAFGLSQASRMLKASSFRFHALAAALFAIVISSHLILYRSMDREGKIDQALSSMFFPRIQHAEELIPSYSHRHLSAVRDALSARGICKDQVTGLESMAMREATNRFFDPLCLRQQSPEKKAQKYFIAPTQDSLLFDFTKNMQPVAILGETFINAPRPLPITINGDGTNNVFTEKKVNYMMYAPVHLEHGLQIAIQPGARQVILRVALRCSQEYPVQQQEFWNIQGGGFAKPMISTHRKYLALFYYDLEWTLALESNIQSATLFSQSEPMDCDVSAIARPKED